MSTFVLVRGSRHGAWCWEKMTPLIERAGHRVLAPDLPGHGDDAASISQISMETYVNRVGESVDNAGGPVILAGHTLFARRARRSVRICNARWSRACPATA